MGASIQENGRTIILMEWELIVGLMELLIKEIGKIMRWTEKDYIPGKMGGFTKEAIRRVKNLDLAFIFGQMVKNFKVCGRMVCSMVKER